MHAGERGGQRLRIVDLRYPVHLRLDGADTKLRQSLFIHTRDIEVANQLRRIALGCRLSRRSFCEKTLDLHFDFLDQRLIAGDEETVARDLRGGQPAARGVAAVVAPRIGRSVHLLDGKAERQAGTLFVAGPISSRTVPGNRNREARHDRR